MAPISKVMDELNTLPGWPEDLEVQVSFEDQAGVIQGPPIHATSSLSTLALTRAYGRALRLDAGKRPHRSTRGSSYQGIPSGL